MWCSEIVTESDAVAVVDLLEESLTLGADESPNPSHSLPPDAGMADLEHQEKGVPLNRESKKRIANPCYSLVTRIRNKLGLTTDDAMEEEAVEEE